ncbi:MAG TPA: carbohydrate ABC transporter permease [Ktedonobacterales bacterium]|nr:carbohydrate ABC transporter permease [Ktedonobacterales bacterium]
MANMPVSVVARAIRRRGSRDGGREDGARRLVGVRAFGARSIVAYVLLFALTVYFLTPLYWLAISATKDNTDLFASFGLWLAHFNLAQNLAQTFTQDGGVYPRWIINTILYAGVGGFLSMLVSVMAGFALAKYRFRGRSLIFGLVLGAVLVPQTTLALPLYMVMSKVNLTNTYWAVLLPSLLSPIGVLLARIYVADAVPNDLLDAARVDGAGELRVFARIVLPLLVPGMVTIFLFQFVAIWNNFFLPLIVLSDPNLFPVNVGLATWNFDPASHATLYNLIVTGSFLAVLPLVVLFLFLQRFWRAGLAFGSVTG